MCDVQAERNRQQWQDAEKRLAEAQVRQRPYECHITHIHPCTADTHAGGSDG